MYQYFKRICYYTKAFYLLKSEKNLQNQIKGCFDGNMCFGLHPCDEERAKALIVEMKEQKRFSKELSLILFMCVLKKRNFSDKKEMGNRIQEFINCNW